ncbi:hypothetical protein [Nocardia veterana]|uniref:Uncharacterized protein n=1 Tax=Nocardia veterana TaxID=132249 RepID=A0A7X6M0Y5_9NOCA|nr:hypothetical protein [Nocardia veterana]NKY87400.1 hypothetical protein [Nocardia veterana]
MTASPHVSDRESRTATQHFDDTMIVHWPEPSRLESWWKAIMKPSRPARPAT